MKFQFAVARPVWPAGLAGECNTLVGFDVSFAHQSEQACLKLTAGSLYRLFCNGHFVGYGPARAAHGYARVDLWPLDAHHLQPGLNFIAIEVAGYNVPSFYVVNEPPFLQAELVVGDMIVAATGREGADGFTARRLTGRVQRVPRYSYQRPFMEVYRLAPSFADWRTGADYTSSQPLPLEPQPPRRLLPRGVALPAFVWHAATLTHAGRAELQPRRKDYWIDRSLLLSGAALGGFAEETMEAQPAWEAQDWLTSSMAPVDPAPRPQSKRGDVLLFDLGRNLSGFIQMQVTCTQPSRLFIAFDEILTGGVVDFHRLDCVNLISYELEPGSYALEAFEAYTCRYLQVLVLEGDPRIERVSLRAYENPETGRALFQTEDETLTAIFQAAEATYAQNTVDLLMDCPSRERAGWLNDSFFSGRSAFLFSGNTRVENNFLQNFAQAPALAGLPCGMIPMCYPADVVEGGHTPNLPCWLICELEEMQRRGGDRQIITSFRSKVEEYFRYLNSLRNEFGLLEKVPGWIFIEWSKANEWTQDVNIPFNLLFSDALAAASGIYGVPEWQAQSDSIRRTVFDLAYDGSFFNDNLVRQGGRLEKSGNHSEICQYHAFWSGIATVEKFPTLWETLVKGCGPLPEIEREARLEPANMIMGRYLRFDLLARAGEHPRLLRELKATFAGMASQTGTLWEHLDHRASCNHGLAAHAAVSLVRDIAGIELADLTTKRVRVTFRDLGLRQGVAVHPLPTGKIVVKWKRLAGEQLCYEIQIPSDFMAEIVNLSGLELVEGRES